MTVNLPTIVLPLGVLPTAQGDAYGLLALFPSGQIAIELDTSWAAAAARLARQLIAPVTCDETLATVGARQGWKTVTPERHHLLLRAAIAFALEHELPPGLTNALADFCTAWPLFYGLRLWESVPAEASFSVVRRKGRQTSEHCVAVLGQNGLEFGLAWYDDRAAFDAMWSGEPFRFDGFSVLASDSAFLEPAFQPFGAPPPTLTRAVDTKGQAPTAATVDFATAVMTLLVRATTGGPFEPLPLSDGSTLELVLPEPAAPQKPKKKATRKAPKPAKPPKKRR